MAQRDRPDLPPVEPVRCSHVGHHDAQQVAHGPQPSQDDPKAFAAAFATSSAAPMFRIVGSTPQAPALASVPGEHDLSVLCAFSAQAMTRRWALARLDLLVACLGTALAAPGPAAADPCKDGSGHGRGYGRGDREGARRRRDRHEREARPEPGAAARSTAPPVAAG